MHNACNSNIFITNSNSMYTMFLPTGQTAAFQEQKTYRRSLPRLVSLKGESIMTAQFVGNSFAETNAKVSKCPAAVCPVAVCPADAGCGLNGCGTAGCGANLCGVDGCTVAGCVINACPIAGCAPADGCLLNVLPIPGPFSEDDTI